jgi:hypothetical protein
MTGYDLDEVESVEELPPAPYNVYQIIKGRLEGDADVAFETLAVKVAEERDIKLNSARVIASEVLDVMENDGKATYRAFRDQAIPKKLWTLTE